jgi:hypothetical protein
VITGYELKPKPALSRRNQMKAEAQRRRISFGDEQPARDLLELGQPVPMPPARDSSEFIGGITLNPQRSTLNLRKKRHAWINSDKSRAGREQVASGLIRKADRIKGILATDEHG